MENLISGLRSVVGEADFMLADGAIDYGAMMEYFVASVILCIVVTSVFRFLGRWFKR